MARSTFALLVRSLPLAATLLVASFVVPTSHASALDCGERVVTDGDSSAYVRSLCGEPISIVTSTLTRTLVGFQGSPRAGGTAAAGSTTVLVERWTYDFGPDRLMVELVFENGVVVAIRTLTRGTYAGHLPNGPGAPQPVYTNRDSRALRRR
jgi:hypothetical protein